MEKGNDATSQPHHVRVCVGSTKKILTEAELIALLMKFRAINHDLGITGLLVYRDGNFIEVLEGRPEALMESENRLLTDFQGHQMIKLMDKPAMIREFQDWSMSFPLVNRSSVRRLEGYSQFVNDRSISEYKTDSIIARLLRQFMTTLR